jgi:methyl-accepting chemotaxis protein
VKELIDRSEREVRGGGQLVSDATRKLERIVAAVDENATLMREMAEAGSSQTSAIQQISVAIQQMDEMTQHNAALVEQTNAAIEQTEAQAAEVDQIVAVFTVDGANNVRAARPKAASAVKAMRPAGQSYPSQGNAALKADDWAEF